MKLNFRHLDQFVCVAEQGSITKAARMLRISQPAITKSLHQLELELRATLFHRGRHGVHPTVFGECLYRHAKRIEGELLRTSQEIDALRGVHQGIITVGAIPTVARRLLPTAILQLNKARPGITVSVTERSNPELLTAFDAGEFDFIMCILDQEDLDPTYVMQTLLYDEIVAVVRPRHPLTKLAKVTPKDLLTYPWIYPRTGGLRRKRIDDFFHSCGLPPPKASVEGSSTSFKLAMLLKSDLITALPESFAMSDEYSKRLVPIKMKPPILRRPIGIIHRGLSNVTPAARALLAEIKRVCRPSRPKSHARR